MEKLHILIMDGDSRQGLPFMRSFRRTGHHVSVTCPWRCCPGYFSRYPNRRLLWPDINSDEEGYRQALFDYLKSDKCDLLIAVGDVTVDFVSRNKSELSKYTKTAIPEHEIFLRAADKSQTMEYCMQNNIPCPLTYSDKKENIEEVIKKVPFPVMIKPIRATGAIGIYYFETKELLLKHYLNIKRKYGALIIQEFIPQKGGTQFQAEAFCNMDSKMTICMVIAKPRFFPVTGGTGTCNITIDRPDIAENVRRLLEGIRWVGSANVDLILDPRDNVPKILEINPRVGTGIKIGFEAAIDYADLQLRLALGKEIPVIKNYKLGVVLRDLGLDILWYIYSDKTARKRTKPNFWKFFGGNIKYQTLRIDDPFPFAGFILGNLLKYTKPGAWSKKLGSDLKG